MNRTGSKILHGMLLATSAMVASPVIVSTAAMANPTGGSVAVGSATITNPSSTQTVINQSSKRALINWNSFNIASGSSVIFNQPNKKSLTVNRVTGPGSSTIDGSLFANGNIWLLNANGILFGKGSQINVYSLLATTSELSDADFRDRKDNFTSSPNSDASVINQGTITASRGGSVVLSAPRVSNEGLIQADLGTVVLGGAQAFTVDMTGDNLLRYQISAPVTQTPKDSNGNAASALVSNSGTISAAGGHVLMTARAAQNVEDSVINNTGMVEATSVSAHDGEVDIDAGPDGTANVGGTVDVSGAGKGQTGGTVMVTGGTVNVADGATINASGSAGGGTVLIGGGPHGTGSLAHAQRAIIGAATITADATQKGNGGNVTIWSDGNTQFNGSISARGGAKGGSGGQIETSGQHLGVGASAKVDTSAPLGLVGDWLLDPQTIDIVSSVPGCGTFPTGIPGNGTITVGSDNNAIDYVLNTTIVSSLSETDVTLEASQTIDVDASVVWSSSHALNLLSEGNIAVNATLQNTSNGSINLIAGWDGTTTNPAQWINSGVFGASGGNIVLQSGIEVGTADGETMLAGHDITLAQGEGTARVGYDGGGSGDIDILATGNLSVGSSSEGIIGNGVGTGTVGGNIVLDVAGAISNGTSAVAIIGNDGGAGTTSGDLTITAGTISLTGIGTDIDTDIVGGDVSITFTNQTSSNLGFLDYDSAHNLAIASTGDLTLSSAITNEGTGSISLDAGGTAFGTSGNLTINGAVTTGGSGGFRNTFEAGDSITIGNAIDVGNGTLYMVAGEKVDGFADTITDPLGEHLLTGAAVALRDEQSGIFDTIGTSADPINVSTDSLAIRAAGDNVWVNSPSGGFDVGAYMPGIGDQGIIGGNVTITANGNVTQGSIFSQGVYTSGSFDLTVSGSGHVIALTGGEGGNQVEGDLSLHNTGDISFTNYGDTMIHAIDGGNSSTSAGNVTISVDDGTLKQDGVIVAHHLTASTTDTTYYPDCYEDCSGPPTPYDITLTSDNNISDGISLTGTGNISLTNTRDTTIDGIYAGGSFTIVTNNDNETAGHNSTIAINGTVGAYGTGVSTLHASGNITDTAGISVYAYSLNLISDHGTVGTAAKPIEINSYYVAATTTNKNIFIDSSEYGFNIGIGDSGISAGTGSVTLSANGSIGQDAAITAKNLTVTVDAGDNDITLDSDENAISGTVVLNASANATFVDSTGFALGASTVGSNLTLSANGNITQTGAASAEDLSVTTTGTHHGITLTNSGNEFTGNVSLNTDSGDAALDNGTDIALAASSVGGNLTLVAAGNVTQSAALSSVGLNVTTTGSGHSISLTADNQVSGTVLLSSAGDADFTNSETTIVGNINAAGLIDVEVNDDNQNVEDNGHSQLLLEGSVDASGTGDTTLHASGDIINVEGSSSITADALNLISDNGSIAGPDPSGDGDSFFIGANINSLHAVTGTDGSILISVGKSFVIGTDEGGLDIGTGGGYIGAASGTITQLDGDNGKIVGTDLTFGAGSPGFTLDNTENQVSGHLDLLTPGNASFTNNGATSIGNISADLFDLTTVGGNFTVTVINGPLTQSGAIYATNLTINMENFVDGSPPVTLTNTSNDVTGTFSVTTPGAVSFTNTGTITLGDVNAGLEGGDFDVAAEDITITSLNGGIDDTGAVIGSDVTLKAKGDITQTGGLDGGNFNVTSTTGNISLLNDNDFDGTVNISAVNGSAAFGNNDNTTLGTVDVKGNVTVLSEGNLTVTSSIQNATGGNITLVGGWDGSTQPGSLQTTGAYGNFDESADGDVFIGDGTTPGLVSVGSKGGLTTIEGHGIYVTAANGSQIGYHGAGGGNINLLATGNVTLGFGEGSGSIVDQIGNGATFGQKGAGNITIVAGQVIASHNGDVAGNDATISTAAGGIGASNDPLIVALNSIAVPFVTIGDSQPANVYISSPGSGISIGNGVNGIQTNGGILSLSAAGNIVQTSSIQSEDAFFSTTSGNITLTAGGNFIAEASFSAPGNVAFYDLTDLTVDGAEFGSNLTLFTTGNLTFADSVQSANGNILAVAGWDGTTGPNGIASNSGSYGNNTGSVTIGGENADGAVEVGSATGKTSIFGDNVTVENDDGLAQLGYEGTGGGAINVTARGDISVTENGDDGNGAFIGNGNLGDSGAVGGNITINAGGDVSLYSQFGTAEIGNQGGGTSLGGTINVTAQGNVSLSSQNDGFAQIGNSGVNDGEAITVGGDVSVTANGSGGIGLTTGGEGGTQIGNFAEGDGSQVGGNITVTANLGGISLTGDNLIGGGTQIGNTGTGSNDPDISGNIIVAANGGDLVLNAEAQESTVQIGNSGFAGGGTMGGNVTVSTSGDLDMTASNVDSIVQIGNGGRENEGAVSGNINVTVTGSISLNATATGEEDEDEFTPPSFALIGNGDLTQQSTGSTSGDIAIKAGGALNFDANTDLDDSDDNDDDVAWIGNIRGSHNGDIESGNVTIVAHSENDEGGNIFGELIVADLGTSEVSGSGGNVFIGLNDAGKIDGLSYDSANTLSIASQGNLNITGTVKNDGAGALNLIAGWDGTTFALDSLTDTGVYGNGSGSVNIGGTKFAAVGSAGGDTTVAGYDVTLNGSNNAAQIGYAGSGSGDINVLATHDVTMTAGECSDCYVQIGNGGDGADGAFGGNINVTAGGNLTLSGSAGYAQIGNGGGSDNEENSSSGNITVNADTLTLTGDPSETNGDDLVQIGNTATGAAASGDININVTGAATFVDTSGGGDVWIGNFARSGGSISGNVTAFVGDFVAQNEANDDPAQFIASDLSGGAVTIGITDPNAENEVGGIDYSSANAFTILTAGSLTIDDHVENSGTGDITIVTGWNPNVAPDDVATTAGAYGNNHGSLTLGGTDTDFGATLGSAGGITTVLTDNLTLDAQNAMAQLGYDGNAGGGDIVVNATGNVLIETEGSEIAQIGNGNLTASGAVGGNITVNAGGNITLTTGASISIAEIGNVGGAGSSQSGNITVTAGDTVSVNASVANTTAQIGNEEIALTDPGVYGNASGNINVTAATVSLIASGAETAADIGNGNPQQYNSNVSGNIAVNIGDLTVSSTGVAGEEGASSDFGSFALIGNRGGVTAHGTVTVNATGDISLGAGDAGNAVIGDATSTGNTSDAVTVTADGTINVNATGTRGHSLIGHAGVNANGNVNVTATGDLSLDASGAGASAEIADFGTGTTAGNVTVASIDGNISVTTAGSNGAFASIGLIADGNSASTTGNVTLTGGNISANASNAGAIANIGGGATGTSAKANVTLSVNGANVSANASASGSIADIGLFANGTGTLSKGAVSVTAANTVLVSQSNGGTALIGSDGLTGGTFSGDTTIIGNTLTGLGNSAVNDLAGGDVTLESLGSGALILADGGTAHSAHDLTVASVGDIDIIGNIQNSGSGDITLIAGWNATVALDSVATTVGAYGNHGGSVTVGGLGANLTLGSSVGSASGATDVLTDALTINSANGTAQLGYTGAGGGDIMVSALGDVEVDSTVARAGNVTAQIGNGGTNVTGTSSGDITITAGGDVTLTASAANGTAEIGNLGGAGSSQSGNITVTADSGTLTLTASGTRSFAHLGSFALGTTAGTSSGNILVNASAVSEVADGNSAFAELGNGDFHLGDIDSGTVSGNITVDTGTLSLVADAGGGTSQARIGNLGDGISNGDLTVNATGNILVSSTNGALTNIGNVGGGSTASIGDLLVQSGGTISLLVVNGGDARIETGGAQTGNVTVNATGNILLQTSGTNADNDSFAFIGSVAGDTGNEDISVTSANGDVSLQAGGANSFALIGNGQSSQTSDGTADVTVSAAKGSLILNGSGAGAIAEIGSLTGTGAMNVTATAMSVSGNAKVAGNSADIVLTGAGNSVGSSETSLLVAVNDVAIQTNNGDAFISSPTQGLSIGVGNNGIALGTGNLTLTADGDITQTKAIDPGFVTITSTNGNITLTNAGNAIDTATLNATGNASLTDSTGLTIAGADVDGTLTLTSGGDLGQSGAITANALVASTSDGNITLTNADNSLFDVSLIASGYAELTDADDLTIAHANVGGTLTLTSGGDLAQTGTINANYLVADTTTGNITLTNAGNTIASASLTATGDASLYDSANLTMTGASVVGNLTLLTTENLTITGQNQAQNGAIVAVAGWDGTTTSASALASTPSSYGNNERIVVVDGMNGNAGLGTYDGSTLVEGYDVKLNGGDGYAQIGYTGASTGSITVNALHDVQLYAADSYAQIGNGGRDIEGVASGAIAVSAGSDVFVYGGFGVPDYAQIGNGGYGSNTGGGTNTGDITINSNYVVVTADEGYAQIGDGGATSTGNNSANITVNASGLVQVAGGGVQTWGYAQIGNGGDSSSGTDAGNINVTAGANVTVTGSGDYAQIGNGGWGAEGTHSGNITVAAGGDVTVQGGSVNSFSYAQIGNGGEVSQGTDSGDITVTADGTLTVAAGDGGMYGQIGNGVDLGSANSDETGPNDDNGGGGTTTSSGNISIVASSLIVDGGAASEEPLTADKYALIGNTATGASASGNITIDVTGTAQIVDQNGSGTAWIGNLATGGAESGSVTLIADTIDGDNDDNDDLGSFIVADLAGGNVTLDNTGTTATKIDKGVTYDSAYNLTVGSGGDITIADTLQNSGTGNITVTSNGTITIGGANASGGSSIGSEGGTTTIAADDVVLSAINGYAQIGYHGGGSGAIIVTATGDVTLNGGAGTASFAQIGDGGYQVSGSNSGAVSVLANGNVTLNAGGGQEAYAQIGNGGAESNSNTSGYTDTGAITVHGNTVALKAGGSSAAYAQIGNGGYKSGQGLNGTATVGGDIVIQAVSAVTLTGNGADAYAQIGNGGDYINDGAANGSGGTINGNVSVAVSNSVPAGNAVTVVAGSGIDSYAQIGDGGDFENTPANGATVNFNVGGNITIADLVLTGANSGPGNGYAQIGNGDAAGTGTGNVGGSININGATVDLTNGTAPNSPARIGDGPPPPPPTNPSTPTSDPTTAGTISTIVQGTTVPTTYPITPPVIPTAPTDFPTGPTGPTPIETLAGTGDPDVPSDGVAHSVSDLKVHVTTTMLIPGVLEEIVTLTPRNPHGVPPADEDYSSWGNEALWRW